MKIKLTNLDKVYQKNNQNEKVQALSQVNLEIDSEETVFIIGESGAGKSTLLSIISLLDNTYEGEYLLDNQDAKKIPESEKAKLRNEIFGFLFQEYELLEDETVYENIEIPLLYSKKIKRKDRKTRIKSMMEIMQLSDFTSKKVKHLSGGQRQRVAIARALINDPEIMVLDEPTGSLNKETSDIVMDYIYDYIERYKKTLILVTHDLEKVKKGKARVIKLHSGKIVSDSIY